MERKTPDAPNPRFPETLKEPTNPVEAAEQTIRRHNYDSRRGYPGPDSEVGDVVDWEEKYASRSRDQIIDGMEERLKGTSEDQ
jgi:hypothetical protein